MLNKHKVKDSTDCYRNLKIKGKTVFFEAWTADTSVFKSERIKAKKLHLKTRIINGELFREVKK